jgi:hypothetical protein
MRLISGCFLFLVLFCSPALAQLCGGPIYNGEAGDTVVANFWLDHICNRGGCSYAMQPSGGEGYSYITQLGGNDFQFQFVTTQAYENLYAVCAGGNCGGTRCHFDIVQITPPAVTNPPSPETPHLFSQGTKDKIKSMSNDAIALGATLVTAANTTALIAPPMAGVAAYFNVIGLVCTVGGVGGNLMATFDPYDADRCAQGPIYQWDNPGAIQEGLGYYDGSGDLGSYGDLSLPNLWNLMVDDAVVIDGLTKMAVDCYPNEMDRAKWAAENAGTRYRTLAGNLSTFNWWIDNLGLNVTNPDGTDPVSVINAVFPEMDGTGATMEAE